MESRKPVGVLKIAGTARANAPLLRRRILWALF